MSKKTSMQVKYLTVSAMLSALGVVMLGLGSLVEVLDLTFAGRIVDFAVVYDNWKGYAFALQNVLKKNGSQEYASYYQKNEKKAIAHFEAVYEQFQSHGE